MARKRKADAAGAESSIASAAASGAVKHRPRCTQIIELTIRYDKDSGMYRIARACPCGAIVRQTRASYDTLSAAEAVLRRASPSAA